MPSLGPRRGSNQIKNNSKKDELENVLEVPDISARKRTPLKEVKIMECFCDKKGVR